MGCFFVLCFYLDKNVDMYLDSDMSAELILSKQLADSGKLFFSDNWFYSTEIRFINTQLIFSQYFRIFENWHLVEWLEVLHYM